MQNKGLIKLFAILFGLVSLYQLSFTFLATKVEDNAAAYANSKSKNNNAREKAIYERKYLDSVSNKDIIDLGITKFTYNDVKDKEMNLGLDLKGGINAILQVSVKEVLISLSNESKNEVFNKALAAADIRQKNSSADYLNLFFEEFEKIAGTTKLSDPSIFGTKALSEKIAFNENNATVKTTLQKEIDGSIGTAFEVLRSRIDKFGVTQPNIQRIGTSGRIQIELPGAKDIERVTKLITSKAELQFWEVHTNAEVLNFFSDANTVVSEMLKDNSATEKDSLKKDDIDNLLGKTVDS
ncbi:MAG: protein translocase subunit SecDF, partial [Flavobacteriaceae bacterium CG_4_8_14_3_um_filter_31_8]